MSSRPRLAQLFIWQGWTLLAALVPSLTVSLLWTPGTLLWKLATVLWVILWGLRLAVWLPVRFSGWAISWKPTVCWSLTAFCFPRCASFLWRLSRLLPYPPTRSSGSADCVPSV